MKAPLAARVALWKSHDPDPETRAELAALEAAANAGDADAESELADRFSGPLAFGTAGLRGLIGAGETRMNRAVIRRTTAGLAAYLLSDPTLNARERGVVVGHDARRMSRVFAEDTARVLAAAGVRAHLSNDMGPTPLVAYAVGALDAAAGVMVTASHNPPAYNGYKVYWGNGAQIIPPHDTGIAAAIDAQPPADAIALQPLEEAKAAGLLHRWPEDLESRYLDAVGALGRRRGDERSAPIVYTPLHGVGAKLGLLALAQAGFSAVTPVPEQVEPDGAFPTVEFPNPEEKGALDLAFGLANRLGADLVLANDPDADRLAAAVRNADGALVQLSGNELGILLGHYLLTERATGEKQRLVIASCVSSPMLGAITRALGARYEETLTGFKWISNRALELGKSEGLDFVFGYEEALGYTVGTLIRDKDGISAALVFAELWAARRAEGKTLLDELDTLARRYGLFASAQRSITMPGADGLSAIGAAMTRLRGANPQTVGPLDVVAISDYATQKRVARGGDTTPLTLPKTNMVVLELAGQSRIIARPSGTEPKLKIYVDVREGVRGDEALEDARGRAQTTVDALVKDFLQLTGLAAAG